MPMNKEKDVRFSYSAIAEPITCLFWNNKQFLQWGQEAGYTSAEFFPYRKTANEIVSMDIQAISDLSRIKSGHVRYNPYATYWKVITRQEDPLRPGVSLGWYNLAFASPEISQKSLQKLETNLKDFHVVTYPYEVNGQNPYGNYKYPTLQTHPAVFADTSNAVKLIKQVKEGKFAGIVWDTFHALEKANVSYSPLANWRISLRKLLEADVVKEVHVQAGRIREKYTEVEDMNWLKNMTGEYPKYNHELGQMLRMIKDMNPTIPLTIEVNLEGLIKAGIINKPKFLHDVLEEAKVVHQQLVDYVKRV